MTWKYYPDKQPNEILKKSDITGNWWTNEIMDVEIQLTAETVQQVYGDIAVAYMELKPLKILFKNPLKAKWRKIRTHSRGYEQLRIVSYGNGIVTEFYDPNKIQSLSTDSVCAYYRYSTLPKTLRSFIEEGK